MKVVLDEATRILAAMLELEALALERGTVPQDARGEPLVTARPVHAELGTNFENIAAGSLRGLRNTSHSGGRWAVNAQWTGNAHQPSEQEATTR